MNLRCLFMFIYEGESNPSPSRRLTASISLTCIKDSLGSINAISTEPNGWKHCAIQLRCAETVSINCRFPALCLPSNLTACHKFHYRNNIILLFSHEPFFINKPSSLHICLRNLFLIIAPRKLLQSEVLQEEITIRLLMLVM